jgi:hypothetical protein
MGAHVTFPRFKTPRPRTTGGGGSRQRAEDIAGQALLFLVEEPGRLSRFLGETGLDPDDLRTSAGTPAMLAAVLDHLLRDESLLLVFAAGANLDPVEIASAERVLADEKMEDGG